MISSLNCQLSWLLHCQMHRVLTKERDSMRGFTMLFMCSILHSFQRISTPLQIMMPGQSIKDGETLVSPDRNFELGFFTTGESKRKYVGLWYKSISPQTIVWVANREAPLSSTSGTLNMTSQGILILLNATNSVVWSSNTSRIAQDPIAQLLETGNLVVRERNDSDPENYLWQGFDFPCDTFMPGMKLGRNLKTGLERYVLSWKTTDDPAPGEFSLRVDTHGYPQMVYKKGPKVQIRVGSWNGQRPTGSPQQNPNTYFTLDFVFNENEVYFEYQLTNSSVFTRYTLNPSGVMQRFTWSDQTKEWMVFSSGQLDQCENYALCGPYASCNISSSPICGCLNGFIPKSPSKWNSSVWSDGCARRTKLGCNDEDDFQKYSEIKVPDTYSSWFDKRIGLKDCKALCLKNCSCTAYANLDITGDGSGCLLWFDDLVDIRSFSLGRQALHVRLAASEFDKIRKERSLGKKQLAAITVSSLILFIGLLTLVMVLFVRRKKGRKNSNIEDKECDLELPIFDLKTILDATDKFSIRNKLGEGGFGSVYKGTLTQGQEIAVKKLSKSSGQGMNEFKNELKIIAKLQHRNLVKLLGCCIHEEETMLIYEYMPNKSLDCFIFDQRRRELLDWRKRIHIIVGIARGLLYLHQDSRLRIIHRDIKASNILLDKQTNPKISDFGLARMFGGDQSEANTKRVVGTYGYMSPEYALDGLFSVKSDVFSFGVVVLEIVSGKKNRGFSQPDQDHNLLGLAWMLWTKGSPMELIDKCLTESCVPSEALRCIHVALLCAQQRPEDRPDMSSVVLMLSSELPLPQPKQAGFLTTRNSTGTDASSSNAQSYSANEISISLLEAR